MKNDKVKVYEALSVVHKEFPEAELVKPDGTREKLSVFIGLAPDVKPRQAVARQRKQENRQISFDFVDNFAAKQRGAND